MASFLSSILSMFSGGTKSDTPSGIVTEPQQHADCTIHASPMREGGQYRLAGRIEKVVNGETLVRTFIRADMFSSTEDAIDGTFRKARQIIDQHGPSLFADGEQTRSV